VAFGDPAERSDLIEQRISGEARRAQGPQCGYPPPKVSRGGAQDRGNERPANHNGEGDRIKERRKGKGHPGRLCKRWANLVNEPIPIPATRPPGLP
jgi:hypothetical protein